MDYDNSLFIMDNAKVGFCRFCIVNPGDIVKVGGVLHEVTDSVHYVPNDVIRVTAAAEAEEVYQRVHKEENDG